MKKGVAIIGLVLVCTILFLVLWLMGIFKKEGDECQPADKVPNGLSYVLDADKKCIVETCASGYTLQTNGTCTFVEKPCTPTADYIVPNALTYKLDASKKCIRDACMTGYDPQTDGSCIISKAVTDAKEKEADDIAKAAKAAADKLIADEAKKAADLAKRAADEKAKIDAAIENDTDGEAYIKLPTEFISKFKTDGNALFDTYTGYSNTLKTILRTHLFDTISLTDVTTISDNISSTFTDLSVSYNKITNPIDADCTALYNKISQIKTDILDNLITNIKRPIVNTNIQAVLTLGFTYDFTKASKSSPMTESQLIQEIRRLVRERILGFIGYIYNLTTRLYTIIMDTNSPSVTKIIYDSSFRNLVYLHPVIYELFKYQNKCPPSKIKITGAERCGDTTFYMKVGFGVDTICSDSVDHYDVSIASSRAPNMNLKKTFKNNGGDTLVGLTLPYGAYNFINKDSSISYTVDAISKNNIKLDSISGQITPTNKPCTNTTFYETESTSLMSAWNDNGNLIKVIVYPERDESASHPEHGVVSAHTDTGAVVSSWQSHAGEESYHFIPKYGYLKASCISGGKPYEFYKEWNEISAVIGTNDTKSGKYKVTADCDTAGDWAQFKNEGWVNGY
jgi:hypothetical protein